MPTVMPLVYRPTLRCFGQVVNRNGLPCGRRAYFMRDSKFPEDVSYFCDECRQPGDTPIADDAPFRRVTVNVEIHIAGASRIHGAAHAEAVARIEQILEGLGGMVTVVSVSSVIGRLDAARIASQALERGNKAG